MSLLTSVTTSITASLKVRTPSTTKCKAVAIGRLRANWLSNSVFETYDDIIDVMCEAWNKLIALPDRIKSIGMREWAHVGRGG